MMDFNVQYLGRWLISVRTPERWKAQEFYCRRIGMIKPLVTLGVEKISYRNRREPPMIQ